MNGQIRWSSRLGVYRNYKDVRALSELNLNVRKNSYLISGT
jgi:hypothetical protein